MLLYFTAARSLLFYWVRETYINVISDVFSAYDFNEPECVLSSYYCYYIPWCTQRLENISRRNIIIFNSTKYIAYVNCALYVIIFQIWCFASRKENKKIIYIHVNTFANRMNNKHYNITHDTMCLRERLSRNCLNLWWDYYKAVVFKMYLWKS